MASIPGERRDFFISRAGEDRDIALVIDEADFAAFYRRSGAQIIHPEVRPVPGFTARGGELKALEAALWRKSGRAAITDLPKPDADCYSAD